MAPPPTFQQAVKESLRELGGEAFGRPLQQALETRLGRKIPLGALYRTLDRMILKGEIKASRLQPREQEISRRRRHFRLVE